MSRCPEMIVVVLAGTVVVVPLVAACVFGGWTMPLRDLRRPALPHPPAEAAGVCTTADPQPCNRRL